MSKDECALTVRVPPALLFEVHAAFAARCSHDLEGPSTVEDVTSSTQ
jgi:hypothetical protein